MLIEKVKNINFQTLNHHLTIVVSNDVHESREKRGHGLPFHVPNDSIRALHSTNGLGHSFIFVPHDVDEGEVVHEAYHAVWTIMKFINATHENEIMAYTLTFIVREIYKTLNKYKQDTVPKVAKAVIKQELKEKSKKDLTKS